MKLFSKPLGKSFGKSLVGSSFSAATSHTRPIIGMMFCLPLLLTACEKPLPPAERPLSTIDTTNLGGDAVSGKALFEDECSKCHRIVKGKNHKGPQLHRIYGANAGSLADYTRYSTAMKNSHIIWDKDNLDSYIAHPKQKVPGGKMLYDGLADAKSRQDIIAYLATLR